MFWTHWSSHLHLIETAVNNYPINDISIQFRDQAVKIHEASKGLKKCIALADACKDVELNDEALDKINILADAAHGQEDKYR